MGALLYLVGIAILLIAMSQWNAVYRHVGAKIPIQFQDGRRMGLVLNAFVWSASGPAAVRRQYMGVTVMFAVGLAMMGGGAAASGQPAGMVGFGLASFASFVVTLRLWIKHRDLL
jgi:hypothetical protein